MSENISVSTTAPVASGLEWSLFAEGHVVAGAIVVRDALVEAQIRLDGHLLYSARHASRAFAENELVALRGHWAREGWTELN
jgi:hypothetical protein